MGIYDSEAGWLSPSKIHRTVWSCFVGGEGRGRDGWGRCGGGLLRGDCAVLLRAWGRGWRSMSRSLRSAPCVSRPPALRSAGYWSDTSGRVAPREVGNLRGLAGLFRGCQDDHTTSLRRADARACSCEESAALCRYAWRCHTRCTRAGVPGPRKALRGGISKSIFQRPCQFLAINAHEMAPRTRRWLQERGRDTPTKGLLWNAACVISVLIPAQLGPLWGGKHGSRVGTDTRLGLTVPPWASCGAMCLASARHLPN